MIGSLKGKGVSFMKNPELLANLIILAGSDKPYESILDSYNILDSYKNIIYIKDANSNPVKLTIKGEKYNLVIVFPTASDSFMTSKLLATEDITTMIDGLDSVTYRVHKTISYEKLVKILKSLPNHANLIPKDSAK